MLILLTGATGLIGKELGKKLVQDGHELIVLSRNPQNAKSLLPYPAKVLPLGADFEDLDPNILQNVEVIINLAGESIGEGRWNKKRKIALYDSRIHTTKKLVQAIKSAHLKDHFKLKTFISASAIGIYGDRGDEMLSEKSHHGVDFLSTICHDWEKESLKVSELGVRVVNPRIGIVLSTQGGALEKMLLPFCLGLGGKISDGKQWMSWIHLQDIVGVISHITQNENITGPINAVAPQPSTNEVFSKTLANALSKPLFIPVPGIVLKLVLGEMSTLVLGSQNVSSHLIQESGYKFKFKDLSSALQNLCEPFKGSQKELIAEQWVPHPPKEIFPFFSDEKNLEKLTPTFLNFKVLGKSTEAIKEGTLIDYRLSLHGIPLKWRTRIENWTPGSQFVDTQLKGPYKLWHHTHDFIEFGGGTLMRDRVLYKVPFGWPGDLFAGLKVRSDVTKIFKYRRTIIKDLFFKS